MGTARELYPQAYMLSDPDLYIPLRAVTGQAGGRIEVTFSKRFYTSKVWQTVQVVSLYQRYTMDTENCPSRRLADGKVRLERPFYEVTGTRFLARWLPKG